MADQDPERIDPRYDPAFQRGYAGAVRMGSRGASTLQRSAAVTPVPARAAIVPAPPPTGAAPPPVEEAAPGPSGTPGDTVASGATATAPSASEGSIAAVAEPASARDVTRNPFYLGAAALAVVLIVAGAVWLNQGFAAIAEGRATTDVGYYAGMTMSFGAPLLIGIGVLIVAGLLFVLARGWRPRDEERERAQR